MQVKTWLQRLTDNDNLWFHAIKAEDEGHFDDAASYYLNDALGCIKQRSLVRAALSCSCAANCLSRMGALSQARTLYSEAANIYVENSDLAMSESIREAMWSLQEAFENYVFANNLEAANAIHNRYLKLAARTSAFFRAGEVEKELELRKATAIEIMSKMTTIATVKKQQETIPDKLAKDIEKLMKARASSVDVNAFDPIYIEKSINSKGVAA
ncbi:MAG TPA: hypothetical protein VE199_01650 [Nitrososphaera sp.]|jgi:hypothetical protein|nr:hypothetical protein [Nitrososphaera sp.]